MRPLVVFWGRCSVKSFSLIFLPGVLLRDEYPGVGLGLPGVGKRVVDQDVGEDTGSKAVGGNQSSKLVSSAWPCSCPPRFKGMDLLSRASAV